MKVGIIGSGLMGAALGRLWARAGHEIVYTFAHSREKLEALARDSGPGARAGEVRDAVRGTDAVLLAVRWSTLDDALAQAGSLDGSIVITCSLPMTEDDSELAIGRTTSGAEELARRLPGARIALAFNTIPSELMTLRLESHAEGSSGDVIYCGDDDEAKSVAATLIRDAGFDPVDAGPLRIARYLEPFALLVGQLAYETELGPELGYRLLPSR
ncbi:NADPH-dependent F420 reductase [Longimicrobium sp.]|uniref:NADPH-dependent F420 reductase n=1 Tax=Longimicrobium sp. TaxID=2029185 RepID=UPI002BFE4695|nr:NADPH-dependent F420 reductase [Longimicrobium sp.]HSU16308.1 NADPH-dependent F420 reductase [Longimicrobium sp.]